MPVAMAKRLNCSNTTSPTSACSTRNRTRACARLTWPDGIGRERVRSTAAIEVAVDDVVPGAAGAAHRERADEEQHEVPGIGGTGVARDRRKAGRPPAWNQEQPRADRPIEPGEAQIGPGPGGRLADRPNCRSNPRPARRRCSSLDGVAGQGVEGALAGLRLFRSRQLGGAKRLGEAWSRDPGAAGPTAQILCLVSSVRA